MSRFSSYKAFPEKNVSVDSLPDEVSVLFC